MSIQVSFVDEPLLFFGALIVVGVASALLAVLDYYTVVTKLAESGREAERKMLLVAKRQQIFRVFTIPLLTPYAVMVWALLYHSHHFWVEQRWHLLFVVIGLFIFVGSTAIEYFFFSAIAEPILLAAAEATGGTIAGDGLDAITAPDVPSTPAGTRAQLGASPAGSDPGNEPAKLLLTQ